MAIERACGRRGGRRRRRRRSRYEREIRQLHQRGLLTVPEASERSGVSCHKLRWLLQRRRIPFVREGQLYGVKLQDVLEARGLEAIHQQGLLTVPEAAAASRVSKDNLYVLIRHRRIPFVRVRGFYGLKLADVRAHEWPAQHTTIRQAARRLGVNPGTIQRRMTQGLFAWVEYHGLRLVKLSDVRQCLRRPAGHVSVRQAAAKVGVCEKTLHNAIRRRELREAIYFGHRIVKMTEARAWMKRPAGYITVPAAASRLRRHEASVYKDIRTGRLEARQHRGILLVKLRDVVGLRPVPRRQLRRQSARRPTTT